MPLHYEKHILRKPAAEWPEPVSRHFKHLNPAQMGMMAQKMQKGLYLFCPQGSHLAMYDDQKVYVEGLIKFILDVGAKRL